MCLAIAVASLAIPASPAYDAWAWLVWGREVGHLDLSTVGGPSWKPFPVIITTALSLSGASTPTFWLIVARTANLLAVVGVYRLGARVAGTVAGVVSAGFVLLSPDVEVRFVRLVLEGHTAAITAALAVWAIEGHLAGRRRLTLLLVFVLALDRPEAWPFLATYAAWCWWADRSHRWCPVALLAAVPILWFGGDWWGSGSPWHGADAARVVASDGHRLGDALARMTEMVPWVTWIAAAFAVVFALARRDRVVPVLAGLAAAWSLLVVAMSAVLGYAALTRFFVPSAAIVCVLGGVGAAWGTSLLWTRSRTVTVLLVAVAVVGAGARAEAFEPTVREMETRDELVHDLDTAIERAGGARAITACGAVSIASADVPRVALAWKLDLPMVGIVRSLPPGGGVLFVAGDARGNRRRSRFVRRFGPDAVSVARTAKWTVLAAGCGTPSRT